MANNYSHYSITKHAVDMAIKRDLAIDRDDAIKVIRATLKFGTSEYASGAEYGFQSRIHIRDRKGRAKGGVIIIDHARKIVETVYISGHVLTPEEIQAKRDAEVRDYLDRRGNTVFDPNEGE